MSDESTIKLVAMMRTCNPWDDAPHGIAEILEDAADVIERLLISRDDARAIASFDEERLEEIITDSIDLDWTPRTAARAIVRAMKGGE
jgi:hypothetical protein